jgi:hypothetical protein
MHTLIMYELGFNQNYYTFTLISRIKIVLCRTKFINHKCFEMRFGEEGLTGTVPVRARPIGTEPRASAPSAATPSPTTRST